MRFAIKFPVILLAVVLCLMASAVYAGLDVQLGTFAPDDATIDPVPQVTLTFNSDASPPASTAWSLSLAQSTEHTGYTRLAGTFNRNYALTTSEYGLSPYVGFGGGLFYLDSTENEFNFDAHIALGISVGVLAIEARWTEARGSEAADGFALMLLTGL